MAGHKIVGSYNAETTAKQPHSTSGAAKQPHPTVLYCCKETAPPYLLYYCCKETAPPHYSALHILGITNKPKKLASTLLQNSSSPQQKEPLLMLWWSRIDMHHKSRTRSRNTEFSTKWALDNFKTCMVAKKKLQQCWTFLHGWTYFDTCYFNI